MFFALHGALRLDQIHQGREPYRQFTAAHNDPVDLEDVQRWFDRKQNYHLIVREPFQSRKSECLLALFDVHEPTKRYGSEVRAQRRRIRESVSTNHG